MYPVYESINVEAYRAKALEAANELYYGKEVKKKIKSAKSVGEIARIMITARRNKK